MPASKSARARMPDEVKHARRLGDSFLTNEITANVMIGTTMIVFVVMLI